MTTHTPRRSRAVRPRLVGARGARAGVFGPPPAAKDETPCAEALAEFKRRYGRVDVRFIDDMAAPADDGRYVTILLLANGAPVEALVLTTEDFYDSLAKLMKAALPSMGRVNAS